MNQQISTSAKSLLLRHAISPDATVREALIALNSLSGESLTLFVVAPGNVLEGTVTDGDIRRALIAGAGLSDSVRSVMHKNFLAADPRNLSVSIAEGRRRHIHLLPVLDGGRIVDIIDTDKIKTVLPFDVVLMAGGRGDRLRPLTDTTPKPLLPVGGKAIIDYNVDELEACGVERIFVTVNYLAEQIEDHFAARDSRARIKCVREPKKLGTIGAVAFIDDIVADNVLVMNSDLLTTIDYEAMYLHHIRTNAGITMAAVPYNVAVPFALMSLKNGRVEGLQEKPTFNYFANAGVYLIRRALLSRIVKGERLDAPDFISSVIADGGEVGCYPIEGTWIDIGSPNDYSYANQLMSQQAATKKS